MKKLEDDQWQRPRSSAAYAYQCGDETQVRQSGSRSVGRPAGSGSSKLAGNGWIHEITGLPSLTRQISLVIVTWRNEDGDITFCETPTLTHRPISFVSSLFSLLSSHFSLPPPSPLPPTVRRLRRHLSHGSVAASFARDRPLGARGRRLLRPPSATRRSGPAAFNIDAAATS
uniref:Uncharacterized protein n=1 Tax=Oryza glumipatula TaxID=40148 RepID=A0A0E0BHG6_9ORYZ